MSSAVSSHLVITGMMGSGKTSVARYLGAELGLQTIDMDDFLESRCGMEISRLIELHGENYFRNLEAELLSEALSSRDFKVISLGGGTLMRDSSRSLVKTRSTVVWLRVELETLIFRLTSAKERPLLDYDALRSSIERRYGERVEGYFASANFIVDSDELTVEQVGDEIIRNIGSLFGSNAFLKLEGGQLPNGFAN